MWDKSLLSLPGQVKANLQPVTLFSIIDHYQRRETEQTRVIGTLLGKKDQHTNTIQITDSFPVPHTENQEQVAINTEFHTTMLALHQRINPELTVVGWYATGNDVTSSSVLFHEFYAANAENPIHLLFDLGSTARRMSVRSFVSNPIALGDVNLGISFQEVMLTLSSTEADQLGLDSIMKSSGAGAADGPISNDVEATKEAMEKTIRKLVDSVKRVADYLEHVSKGERSPDPRVIQLLQSALATVPTIQTSASDKFFNGQLQDVMSIVYLANLVRAQLTLAEKLQAVGGAPSGPES